MFSTVFFRYPYIHLFNLKTIWSIFLHLYLRQHPDLTCCHATKACPPRLSIDTPHGWARDDASYCKPSNLESPKKPPNLWDIKATGDTRQVVDFCWDVLRIVIIFGCCSIIFIHFRVICHFSSIGFYAERVTGRMLVPGTLLVQLSFLCQRLRCIQWALTCLLTIHPFRLGKRVQLERVHLVTIVLVQPAPRLALKIQFMHLYMQYLFLWYDKNICG